MRAYFVPLLAGAIILFAVVSVYVGPHEVVDTPISESSPNSAQSLRSASEGETEIAVAELAVIESIEQPRIEPERAYTLASTQENEKEPDESPFVNSPEQSRDEKFASEPVDTEWAPGVEATIDATLRSNKVFVEFENIDIECRTTMCRVNIVHNEPLPPPAEDEWGIEAELSILLRPVIDQNTPRLRGSASYTRYPQSDEERMITGIYLLPAGG